MHNLVNSGQFEKCSQIAGKFKVFCLWKCPPTPAPPKKKSGKVFSGDTAHIKYPGNNYLLLYLTQFLWLTYKFSFLSSLNLNLKCSEKIECKVLKLWAAKGMENPGKNALNWTISILQLIHTIQEMPTKENKVGDGSWRKAMLTL